VNIIFFSIHKSIKMYSHLQVLVYVSLSAWFIYIYIYIYIYLWGGGARACVRACVCVCVGLLLGVLTVFMSWSYIVCFWMLGISSIICINTIGLSCKMRTWLLIIQIRQLFKYKYNCVCCERLWKLKLAEIAIAEMHIH